MTSTTADQLRALAERIARELFTDGCDERAQRLVLKMDTPVSRELGGWSEGAVVDVLVKILKEAALLAAPLPQPEGWQPLVCKSCGCTREKHFDGGRDTYPLGRTYCVCGSCTAWVPTLPPAPLVTDTKEK